MEFGARTEQNDLNGFDELKATAKNIRVAIAEAVKVKVKRNSVEPEENAFA